jgi:hypothetical protein
MMGYPNYYENAINWYIRRRLYPKTPILSLRRLCTINGLTLHTPLWRLYVILYVRLSHSHTIFFAYGTLFFRINSHTIFFVVFWDFQAMGNAYTIADALLSVYIHRYYLDSGHRLVWPVTVYMPVAYLTTLHYIRCLSAIHSYRYTPPHAFMSAIIALLACSLYYHMNSLLLCVHYILPNNQGSIPITLIPTVWYSYIFLRMVSKRLFFWFLLKIFFHWGVFFKSPNSSLLF